MIRLMQPRFGDLEIDAVHRVFEDAWPGAGPRVKEFKENFAKYISVSPDKLVPVFCCTEGMFQICQALGLRPGDEVILPTVSFVGAAHAVKANGGTVRLVDVDPHTLNPTVDAIRNAITPNTRAILVLHYGGRAGSIDGIAKLAREHGIFLLEDGATGLGGSKNGVSLGTHGDAGVWSFDAMKLLSAGDGGMIFVRDEFLRERIFQNVHLGGAGTGQSKSGTSDRWWESDPQHAGRRSMMNDLSAAIANAQLSQIEEFIAKRRNVHRAYSAMVSDLDGEIKLPVLGDEDVPYFYWVQLLANHRDFVAKYMLDRGIYTSFRYWPLHRMSLYQVEEEFPGADCAADTTLLLPLHQSLTGDEVEQVVRVFREALELCGLKK